MRLRVKAVITFVACLALAGGMSSTAFGEESKAPKQDESKPSKPASRKAPARYKAELLTTQGPIVIEVERDWAPRGADRFYQLVKSGYFTNVAFFRVIDGFMAQAGISGDPGTTAKWRNKRIPDDPVKLSNTRGTVTFAMAGPGSRTTQFYINLVDNTRLDSMGFSPFGKVKNMKAADALYSGYGEGAPAGKGPSQAVMQREGNAYLKKYFPKLDYIKSAKILN
ncbi:MAG: peptidylprolyl isomerase [Myxococcota bacterium]